MEARKLIAWTLVAYGITLVVTGSKLTAPLRRELAAAAKAQAQTDLRGGRAFLAGMAIWWLNGLMRCPMCFGWWVGLGLGLGGLGPAHGLDWPRPVAVLGNAFAASAVCWAIHVVLARLGAQEL